MSKEVSNEKLSEKSLMNAITDFRKEHGDTPLFFKPTHVSINVAVPIAGALKEYIGRK